MTAQIVVMNGYGIAIASDSALSLGSIRTFETAEKIYPLKLPHRLAVLHCGSVNFGGIPFPVLIADWKRQLADKALRDADAYAENFLDWLEHHTEWFSDVRHENQFMRFVEARVSRIEEMIIEYREADEFLDVCERLTTWTAECEEAGFWEGIDPDDILKFSKTVITDINELIEASTEAKEILLANIDLFINYLAVCYASKVLVSQDFIPNATLVFAGYGDNEILPGYVSVDIAGVLKDKVGFSKGDSDTLSTDQSYLFGIFMPAQKDAMELFLRGVDWDNQKAVISRINEHFASISERITEINDGENPELDSFMETSLAEFEDKLYEATRETSEKNYLKDLRSSLVSLPLASLANVAKALVEIQGLRQTTAAQFNSVGGPTDVAIIETLEGFTWVQHKSI